MTSADTSHCAARRAPRASVRRARLGRPRVRGWSGRVAALAAVALVLVVGGAVSPASALTLSAGYGGASGYLGLWDDNGHRVVCIDPGGPDSISKPASGWSLESAPISSTSGGMTCTYDATATARLNFVLSTWGDTSDNATAAAVELVSWALSSSNGRTCIQEAVRLKGGSTGSYSTVRNAADWLSFRAPAGARAAIMSAFDSIYAAALARTAGTPATPSLPTVGWTKHAGESVDLTLAFGANTNSIDLTLTNGKFTDTGLATRTITAGGTFAVTIPQPGEVAVDYTVRGPAAGTAWPSNLRVFRGAGQVMAAAGSPQQPSTVSNRDIDPDREPAWFEPMLTSQVAAPYYQPGDVPSDTVTFSVVDPANDVWLQNALTGVEYPVVASAILYGPFAAPQTQATDVPVDAPVAGTATATSGNPHSAPILATLDQAITQPGYYYWVWSIDYADQSAGTKGRIPGSADSGLPEYAWHDDFAIAAETSIVIPDVTTTAVAEAGAGGVLHDTAHIGDPVLPGETVSFDLYKLGDGTTIPASPVCEVGNLVASVGPVAVTAAGDVDSPEVRVYEPGVYGWIETLRDGSGVVIQTGACGEPGEFSTVTNPVVATQIQNSGVLIPTELSDSIEVTGTHGASYQVRADLYRFPWRYDEAGNIVTDGDPVCDAATLLGTTDTITVTGDDTVTTNGIPITEDGIYGFVETTWTMNGTAQVIVSTGVCGEATETATVTRVAVTTEISTQTASVGDRVFDTGIVCGTTRPGDLLRFDIYRQLGDTPSEDDVLVFTDKDVPVTEGTFTDPDCLRVRSASWTVDRAGRYYAVETMTRTDGHTIARDERGAAGESFTATDLARTGFEGGGIALAAVLVVLGGGGLIGAGIHTRRHNGHDITE